MMSLSDIAGQLQIAKQCIFLLNVIDYYYCCSYYRILIDIDECVEVPGTCDQNATCSNLIGGYNCTCNSGYMGSGTICSSMFPI